mmetsp:Transcript_68351/g.164005  ORF Transcript_68351/g.164005 Transcript_68351/m.164005 type:complete len:627 (-) Transcript_68351:64-1944(-)
MGESETPFIDGPGPPALSWLLFLFVSLYTLRNVCKHLLNYSRPDLQAHVLRIILVGPIYAFCSALCLSMRESSCFFVTAIRDIWEAVVIYSFLTLIVEYMGGEHLCLHTLSQQEGSVSHPFPFNYCFSPVPMASMIRLPKIGALQFVVVKPVVAIFSIVVYAMGEYETFLWQFTLVIVYNVSYTLALYGLGMVYKVAHTHAALKSKNPLMKFLSVKMIVFLTFWQALFLPVFFSAETQDRWEDLILSIEMAFFSVLMNEAFSWREFDWRGTGKAKTGGNDASDSTAKGDVQACGQPGATGQGAAQPGGPDLESGAAGQAATSANAAAVGAQVVGNTSPPAGKFRADAGAVVSSLQADSKVMMQNARSVFDPRDVFNDATRNFSRRYQQHVLLEDAQEHELREQDERDAGVGEAGEGGSAGAEGSGNRLAQNLNILKEVRSRTMSATTSFLRGSRQYTRDNTEDGGADASPKTAKSQEASATAVASAIAAMGSAEMSGAEPASQAVSQAGEVLQGTSAAEQSLDVEDDKHLRAVAEAEALARDLREAAMGGDNATATASAAVVDSLPPPPTLEAHPVQLAPSPFADGNVTAAAAIATPAPEPEATAAADAAEGAESAATEPHLENQI